MIARQLPPDGRKIPFGGAMRLGAVLLGSVMMWMWAGAAMARSSAVLIMYHRFDEGRYPSTNTTLEQLEAHIAELTSGSYTVLPVERIVDRLRAGEDLPDHTVGITIDDAYRSIYTKAWPRFRAAGLPFTVFASTAHVDQRSSNHLSWDQIREMRDSGLVSFGHHTVTHLHMPKATPEKIDAELRNAAKRFKAELGEAPVLFAYPYGETSLAVSDAVRAAGFKAAFGQHSGAAGGVRDFFNLPRFAMNEQYGNIDRFRLAVNALALPVSDITPADPVIRDDNPPAIGFTLKSPLPGDKGLACFTSHAGKAQLERLGPRVEVRVAKPFPMGRTRLNCTMRTPEGRWRWLGRMFLRIE